MKYWLILLLITIYCAPALASNYYQSRGDAAQSGYYPYAFDTAVLSYNI